MPALVPLIPGPRAFASRVTSAASVTVARGVAEIAGASPAERARGQHFNALLALNPPPEMGERVVDQRDPSVAQFSQQIRDDIRYVESLSPRELAALVQAGTAHLDNLQHDLRRRFEDGLGVEVDGDEDDRVDDDADDARTSARRSADKAKYVRFSQRRSATRLRRSGNVATLLAERVCDKCGNTAAATVVCDTCDVNGHALCPKCDIDTHLRAQDHSRSVLARNVAAGGDAAPTFVQLLSPSEFVRADFSCAEGTSGVDLAGDDIERHILPASFSLLTPHRCSSTDSCWRADATRLGQHSYRTLGVNGVIVHADPTHARCRGCGVEFSLLSETTDADSAVEHVTLDRSRCALSQTMLRVVLAVQSSAEGAFTIGRVQHFLETVCGYTPPKKTLGVALRQSQQLEMLAVRRLVMADVSCLCCSGRPDAVLGGDGSFMASRFKQPGWDGGLVVSGTAIVPDSDTAAALAASAPLKIVPAGCSAQGDSNDGGDWFAAMGGQRSSIYAVLGQYSIACSHGAVIYSHLMKAHESPRYVIMIMMQILQLVCKAVAAVPSQSASAAPVPAGSAPSAAPAVMPGARAATAPGAVRARGAGPVRSGAAAATAVAPAAPGIIAPVASISAIIQVDIACIGVRFLLAQLREDPQWLSRVFRAVFPAEGERLVFIADSDFPPNDWHLRIGNPTIKLTVSDRPAGARGVEGFPATAFIATVNFVIGGLHAPAHDCCNKVHQFDRVSMPRAGVDSDFVEWAMALFQRWAAAGRALGPGQFRLYWDTAIAAQRLALATALPHNLVRAYGNARAAVVETRTNLVDALGEFNRGRQPRNIVSFDGAATFVTRAVADFNARVSVDRADSQATVTAKGSIVRALRLRAAQGALSAALRACGVSYRAPQPRDSFERAPAAGSKRVRSELPEPPPSGPRGLRGRSRPPIPSTPPSTTLRYTESQINMFRMAIRASQDLQLLRKFQGFVVADLIDINEGVRFLAALDKELERPVYAISRMDTVGVLRDNIVRLRDLVGAMASLRARFVASVKTHGDHDDQVSKIRTALMRIGIKADHLRDLIVTLSKGTAAHDVLKTLPPGRELLAAHFVDAYVPRSLQPPVPAHEASWVSLMVTLRKHEAAQVELERVVADIANSSRVCARERDDAAERGIALARCSAPTRDDLAVAAGKSLLVVPAGADVKLMPFTAVPRNSTDCLLMARGLQTLLQREVLRLTKLDTMLARLNAGVQEVERTAPAPAALPVDRVGRTLIGQSASRLLCGDMTPDEWAVLAVPVPAGAPRSRVVHGDDDDDDDYAEDELGDVGGDGDGDGEADFALRAARATVRASEEAGALYDGTTVTLLPGAE